MATGITSLPPEIWKDIITQACVDGGPTGRSLAISCRFLHSQSSDTRFYSLALKSLRQVEGFLSYARSQPPDWKPVIRHVWLSFLNEPAADHASSSWDSRFVVAMNALSVFASHSVRTLCMLKAGTQPYPLSHCVLPVLEELTLFGDGITSFIPSLPPPWPPSYHLDEGAEPSIQGSHLPALKRLHVAARKPETYKALLTISPLSASPITHLRISDIPGTEHGIAHDLACALGFPESALLPNGPTSVVRKDAKFPEVERLLVHMIQGPPAGWNRILMYSAVLTLLQAVIRAANRVEGMDAVLLLRNAGGHVISEEERAQMLWRDWISRMEGGMGCWVDGTNGNFGNSGEAHHSFTR